jgi:erythromycin esterase
MAESGQRLPRAFYALILLLTLLLASCSSGGSSASRATQTPSGDPAVVRWIQQNAHRLTTVDPSAAATDLGMLPRVVGNASVVGLGEETHGTHELIDIKARLTEYLIEHLGFTTFVMENDWGSSRLLNAYIHGGSGDLPTIMSQSLFPSWDTQEYEALFAWMRAYNADPSHPNAIQFLGMDLQDVSQSDFDAVQQYVQQVDPGQAPSVQSLYAPIISSGLPHPYPKYTPLNAATKQQYQTQAQNVYDLLQWTCSQDT